MTLGVSVVVDTGRALMAAMQPLTGGRAGGLIAMQAKPGVVLEIPQHSYWCPVLDGQRETSMLFKAAQGPNPNGSWTVDDSGTSLIGVMSNIGGIRHNIDAGTPFQADIPIDGLVRSGAGAPAADADFDGATDPADYCGVRDMVVFESFDGPALTLDIARSQLTHFPGVLLAFQNMEPADGVAIAQNDQGSVNAGDGKKFYKVTYSISVITTIGDGDMARRQEGLYIADTIVQLLMDKHQGDVGESLSNPGGVQVRTLTRESGPQDIYKKFYIYTVLVSAMTAITRLDFRQYNPWLRAILNVDKPQIPALPDQGDYPMVEGMEIDMTPGQLDFALDGTFARAGGANLWVPAAIEGEIGQLTPFAGGERRVVNPARGVYMEPTIDNDLGSAAEDLAAPGWAVVAAAAVTSNLEADPLGNPASADKITFPADADSRLEFAGPLAPAGEPVVVTVFAKAPGSKFKTSIRLGAEDSAAALHLSDPIPVANEWDWYRFEFVPTAAGAITLRLQNDSDGQVREIMVWGVNYSDDARWGAQYPGVASKVEDALTFTPPPVAGQQANLVTPLSVLTGRWRLRYITPADVPPDVLGTAAGAPVRTLVSVGNGATDLFALRLTGTPGAGGATLELVTRADGSVVSLAGMEWTPGAELALTIDAIEGSFQVEGTNNADDTYPFPGYAPDVLPADFLTIGDSSDGTSAPAPGFYVSLEDVERS